MSGLISRYAVLVMAAAMTGLTAFTVVPGDPPPQYRLDSPEPILGRSIGPPPVAGVTSRLAPTPSRMSDVRLTARKAGPIPDQTSATLVFGGDMLVHNGVRSSAFRGDGEYDFRPNLAGIRPVVSSADLAICHLEVPLGYDDSSYSSYPRFRAPNEFAEAIAYAGFDGCSTASNHSIDQGVEGLVETLQILDDAGVSHAGTARTPIEARNATIHDLGYLQVAHLAATWWLNGLATPAGLEWMVQDLDTDELIDMAHRSRMSGADLVVVSIHCCAEYRSDPTPQQMEAFERLISSPDIDLVVGHHSHVVGPVDRIDGELVVYGLGNLLSGQLHRTDTREGVLAVAEANWRDGQWTVTSISALPTWVESGTYAVMPADPSGASYQRTMEALRSRGVDVGAVREGSPGG